MNCGYHHHWFLTSVHLWLLSFCFLWDKFCLLLHVGNVCLSAYTFTVDFVACLCQIRSLCFIGQWHFKWPTVPVLFANVFCFFMCLYWTFTETIFISRQHCLMTDVPHSWRAAGSCAAEYMISIHCKGFILSLHVNIWFLFVIALLKYGHSTTHFYLD